MTEDATKLIETLSLGKRLLKEFELDDWTFDLSNHKVIMGQCIYDEKKIVFSAHFLNQPFSEIDDTIRHEIAHALCDPDDGHNETWRMMCLRVGAKPERCYDDGIKSTAKPNYYIECSACGKQWDRYRLRRRAFVGAKSSCCSAELKFYKRVKKG